MPESADVPAMASESAVVLAATQVAAESADVMAVAVDVAQPIAVSEAAAAVAA